MARPWAAAWLSWRGALLRLRRPQPEALRRAPGVSARPSPGPAAPRSGLDLRAGPPGAAALPQSWARPGAPQRGRRLRSAGTRQRRGKSDSPWGQVGVPGCAASGWPSPRLACAASAAVLGLLSSSSLEEPLKSSSLPDSLSLSALRRRAMAGLPADPHLSAPQTDGQAVPAGQGPGYCKARCAGALTASRLSRLKPQTDSPWPRPALRAARHGLPQARPRSAALCARSSCVPAGSGPVASPAAAGLRAGRRGAHLARRPAGPQKAVLGSRCSLGRLCQAGLSSGCAA